MHIYYIRIKYSMPTLPMELKALIQEYRSDKVGVHPTAQLIKRLQFRNDAVNPNTGIESTLVIAYGPDCFYRRRWGLVSMYASATREYYHSDFDERIHPHHFGIHLGWENMMVQDDIEKQINEIGLEQFVVLNWL